MLQPGIAVRLSADLPWLMVCHRANAPRQHRLQFPTEHAFKLQTGLLKTVQVSLMPGALLGPAAGRDLRLEEQLLRSYSSSPQGVIRGGAQLGPEQVAIVQEADTFFLATCFDGPVGEGVHPGARGCDMSHR